MLILGLGAACARETVQDQQGQIPQIPSTPARRLPADPTAATVAAVPTDGTDVSDPAGTLLPMRVTAEPAPVDTSTVVETARPLDGTTNILILGSDRRPDTPNWRTDVMMIVALDFAAGRAGVISIPRDIYLDEIPNHQPNRMNVVDYLGEQDAPGGGGAALMAEIIQARMDIPIHHYLRFDFDSFRTVVDALGGVELELECEFRGYIEEEGGWLVLEPGANRLAGNQAMIYVRDRELTGGDLSRAQRQQRFVWAVRNQVLGENLLPRIPALYSALRGAVDTDIGLVTALRFVRFALDVNPDDLHGMVIAPPEMVEMGWRNGMSVFVADWPLIAAEVQQIFTGPPFADAGAASDCVP